MFKFNEMITPKIIGLLYVITLIITGLMIIGCLLDHQIGGALAAVLLFVFSRVFFELLIVKFKNNEYLRDSRNYLKRIADSLDGGAHEEPEEKKEKTDCWESRHASN